MTIKRKLLPQPISEERKKLFIEEYKPHLSSSHRQATTAKEFDQSVHTDVSDCSSDIVFIGSVAVADQNAEDFGENFDGICEEGVSVELNES